ncbi:ImmA/IrrE family metallo-endopeptidase [Methylophaga pinxianii]|uniref:ImmA/IrrE family metallo-endopeptidase n=1 Tax=Methylophaga pinxianii TaxID=2881052 RepID=UPI001CF359CD|nr:ImmA/IrrE family metallo-endopeptidase [Methylophaga pinxianii]MCB2427895.1 ImmA/IrrE family metallo-endopeptidase [Methylophaga pinxianii]UPH44685.1 ImmA/IrrE family metallo-endopeptidase [Methylophaga pinxianii]
MEAKIIRTEEQYTAYLDEVQALISESPTLNSEKSERLELLTVLLESYENSKYPVESPDPIDAILFRMNEKGLKQADLIPYFGTSSRVSEVLNRKRPLTVQMIRALTIGLGISAETLVGASLTAPPNNKKSVDWSKFPIKEMSRRGWISKAGKIAKNNIEDLVKGFISDAGLEFGAASFRKTFYGEAETPTSRYALYAWLARVIQKAREKKSSTSKFNPDDLSSSYLKELAQLSRFDTGPLLAIEQLEKTGIVVIIEPALKGTLLDGAALKDADGTPIIGLTLRYDRLDHFWFTLLHEIAHIWKHVDGNEAFLDDLDSSSEDRKEAEANRLATEAFIPRVQWRRSDAYTAPSKDSIERFAKDLKIHPALVAGRLRKESGNYSLFSDMLGQNQVRQLFPSSQECEA